MTIAIMQPYIFPYVGYFHLIMAVEKFIFYDDVDFIKRGWINRNRILLDGKEYLFSVPCIKPTYKKKICDIKVDLNSPEIQKLLKTFYHAYSKAPFFSVIYPLLLKVFHPRLTSISALSIDSIKMVMDYLEVKKVFKVSSMQGYNNIDMDKANRLIDITKQEGESVYINPKGGDSLYDKPYFKEQNIDLVFLQPEFTEYKQNTSGFVAGLSIIDVLMHCDKEQVLKILANYNLK